MADLIPITKLLKAKRFLRTGDFFETPFKPMVGQVDARVMDVVFPTIGPLSAGDINELGRNFKRPAKIRLEIKLFRPGTTQAVKTQLVDASASVDVNGKVSITTPSLLKFSIPGNQAGGRWRCRFTNLGQSMVVTTGVNFVTEIHNQITTPIAFRVLNHGLQQALDALQLRVHLDGDNSFIDVSDELKKLSGGKLKRFTFSLPSIVQDFNLSTFQIIVRRVARKPVITILIQLETRGVELEFFDLDLLDLSTAAIVVNLELHQVLDGATLRSHSTIDVKPTAEVQFQGNVILLDLLLGPLASTALIDQIQDILSGALNDAINSKLFLSTSGRYLAEAFAQLAGRGHRLFSISANATNVVVNHYDPNEQLDGTGTGPIKPGPSLEPVNPSDQLKAKLINSVGLANLAKIEHIVVLMQENRSFDHLLGYLKKEGLRPDVDGLTGDETNSLFGIPNVKVNRLTAVNSPEPRTLKRLPDTVFPFGPNHDYEPVKSQIGVRKVKRVEKGKEVEKEIGTGDMAGFLASFVERFPSADVRLAMGYYTGDQLAADNPPSTFEFLVNQFLVCDKWFCSHPGPTQPNRFCTLSGKTPVVDNFEVDDPDLGFLQLPTFFDLLSKEGIDWVYYEHDVAFLRLYDRYRLDDTHIIPIDDEEEGFLARLKRGTLPKVTFIDPDFTDVPLGSVPNDDHPPADLKLGQKLIGCIYNALVSHKSIWEKTLFIVTYDEHGGFYDHVPPPGTEAWKKLFENDPSKRNVLVPSINPNGDTFMGVRVPTFVVSPWVEAQTVNSTVFDHTAIAKTILVKFFGSKPPHLGSRRLLLSPHLGRLLERDEVRTNIPRLSVKCEDKFVPPRRPRPRPPRSEPAPPPRDFHEAMKSFAKPKISELV